MITIFGNELTDSVWLGDKLFDVSNVNDDSIITYKGVEIKGQEQISKFVEIIWATTTDIVVDKLTSNLPVLQTREIKPKDNGNGLGGLFGAMARMNLPLIDSVNK